MTQTVIIAVLALIEQILPLVMGSKNAQTTQAIDSIIQAIEGLLPTIINWSTDMYQVASNILSTLADSGTLTNDQKAATIALGASVDAEWSKVLPQIDPDNPANAGTLAGDLGASS